MVPEPRRDLSVEELIDLEQQAEFFVVLGQDEAAIDLLMGHVRNTGGISPLPYLKLLEIYKRRGERSAYERIRERFNRRFNAYAPDWDADLTHGKSLEDYPGTMVKLEGLWAMPHRVMEVLDAMLFRRDESEEAYDLPAYRELLFLYSVARDFTTRSAQEAGGEGVDLLLPLDEPMPLLTLRPTHTSPGPLQRSETGPAALDLDMTSPMPVDFDPSPAPPRAAPAQVRQQSANSDFLDLTELPTGPGKLEPRR
jgi:pilus assembly protein FimV